MSAYGDVTIRIKGDPSNFVRAMTAAKAAASDTFHDITDNIDTTNDRTAWLAQGIMALAPMMVPIGAAAIPIFTGIATQATVGVAAIGAMALAFSGMGDALKALNKYQLEPTAENFAAMQLEMEKMGPQGEDFVRFLDDIGGQLAILKQDARGGMFPGMTEGIESAMELLPRMRDIITEISQGIGTLASDAGAGIAGPEFREFFDYLASDGKDILVDMGRTMGNFVDGFASILVAFGPLTADFSDGLLGMSRSFEQWAEQLDSTQGFQEFVDYIRASGPQVADLIGSLSNAFVQLVEAAAPIGSAALPVLTKFLDVLAGILDTPVGSLLVLTGALTGLYGRIMALRTITTGGVMGPLTKGFRESASAAKTTIPTLSTWGTALGSAARSQKQLKDNMMSGIPAYEASARKASAAKFAVADFAKAAAPAAGAIGLLTVSMTGLADSAGLGSTAMGAVMGLMFGGGPWGAALGAGIGAIMDIKAAQDDWSAAIKATDTAIQALDIASMTAQLEDWKSTLDEQLEGTEWEDVGDVFGDIGRSFRDTFSGDFMGNEHTEEARNQIERLTSSLAIAQQLTGDGWQTDGLELFRLALGKTADGAERASDEMREFTAAVAASMGILDRQAALDAVEAAIDNARKGFKEFGATLDNNTEKGRTNRANLREIASSALTASDHLKGMAKVDFLESMVPRLARMADLLGMNKKQARDFAREILGLDELEATPTVQVNDKEGRRRVREMMTEMGLLDGKRADPTVAILYSQFLRGKVTVENMMRILNGLKASPTVTANTGSAVTNINTVIAAIARVQGKTVYITTVFQRKNIDINRASGGLIQGPGGPRDDVIPVMASNREYIIKAAAVEKYGVAMMDSINNMQAPTSGPAGLAAAVSANRFAGGGSVGRWTGGGGGTQTIIHEVRVTGGLHARRGMAHIAQMADGISRRNAADEYDQRDAFNRREWGN